MKNFYFIYVCIFLSGCADIDSQTGSISWDPPSLSQQNCPDLSGVYKDQSFKALSSNQKVSLYSILPTIPLPTEKNIEKELKPRAKHIFYKTYPYSNTFNELALTKLTKKNTNELTVSFMDDKGKLYKEKVVGLRQSGIGCDMRKLVLRDVLISPGIEGGGGFGTAREIKFKKSKNGNLQVEVYERDWYYSRISGLSEKMISEPKRYIVVFKKVR